jgi:uncharacterized membrane protein YeaQ/YmgE (transglycosylase-associated protein family)
MEKRAISFSLLAALISYFVARALLNVHKFFTGILSDKTENIIGPFLFALGQLIQTLPWLVPGAIAGYLCTKNPIKNGAAAGAIFGVAFGLIGIVYARSQTHDISTQLYQLSYTAAHSLRCAFLFAISASLGYLIASRHKAL